MTGTKGEPLTFSGSPSGCPADAVESSISMCAQDEPCSTQGGLRALQPHHFQSTYRTQELDNAAWVLDQYHSAFPTVTANACQAPDGTMTAALVCWPAIGDTGRTAYSVLYKTITITAAAWNNSVYIRAADAQDGGTLYLSNAFAPTPSTSMDAGAEWGRYSMTFTSGGASENFTFGPDTRAALIPNQPDTQPSLCACLWEAQAELGSVATSPIENAGTALTRAATLATVPNPLYGLNTTSWCMGGSLQPLGSAWASLPGFPGVVSVGSYASANSAGIFVTPATGVPRLVVYDATGATKQVTTNAAISFAAHTIVACTDNGALSI